MKFDDVTVIAEALMSKRTDELPEHYRDRLMELSKVDDIIRMYGAGPKAKSMIQQELRVRPTACLELIAKAQMLFGSTSVYEKAYWKSISLERMAQLLHASFTELMEVGEDGQQTGRLKTTASMKDVQMYAKLEQTFHELLGTNREDDNLPGGQVPETIMPAFDPAQLGIAPSPVSVDQILRMFNERSEDVPFTEVPDEPEA